MNRFGRGEIIAERMKNILKKDCPAFVYEASPGGAVWHKCNCSVLLGSCVCIWHIKSECPMGEWPQLDFVDIKKGEDRIKMDIMTKKVKEAIKGFGGKVNE